ncbi:fimbrial protein [Lelliottia sp. V89_10]|uniref:fimbrial protein n=1 Tax=Lelliottia wanjuensis TaxID=3050585 RepID=UPI00249E1A68|nr:MULTISPECIES: fimbrial protein [unclassified Lelliottia]MDI3360350.1 fimbrial protein [Lelliottia sp. V89_13]MDK9549424.1 fimbrial protein [Lelliottia sp. V89_5]MDK9596161.1 fimbrial protein [Lelliottia sp. V89_10]
MRKEIWITSLLIFASVCMNSWAEQNTAIITVNVTINVAPCEINNNQSIDVDFGSEVAVTDVAVGLVEKPINYNLDCSSADTAKSLKMVIQGVGAEFDADVLKTTMTDLGVKIKADGSDYPLNSILNLASKDSKPVLSALLVQKPGARLETGAFNAGATMTVDYQ